MNFDVEVEQEEDGRWLAEVPKLPGVMSYGATQSEAIARVRVLALRAMADRLEGPGYVPEGTAPFASILRLGAERLERGEPLPDLETYFSG